MISNILTITKRELRGYFGAPVAYVFIVIFLILSGFFTMHVSKFYEAGQADLRALFIWQPWLCLFLVPSVAMRLWAEERRSGTIEILLTLPVTVGQAVVGKFLAAWLFIAIAFALTFPLVLTVLYLGHPDLGPVLAGYLGSLLLAGAYLAIGGFTSALTRSQVISFILAVVVCLFFVLAGWPPVTDALTKWMGAGSLAASFVAALGFMPHFESIQRGVLDSRDLLYYASLIFFMLCATTAVLHNRKAS